MEILRSIAYAYILHTIGELDETSSNELMRQLAEQHLTADNRSIEDEMAIFESEQSVTVDAVEWIKNTWSESQDQNPKVFANNILDDFMTTLW